jgi:hypothetical protein
MNRTNLFTFFLCALLITGCDMAEEADSETDGQAPALADLHAGAADQRTLKKSKARKNQSSHPDKCYDDPGGEAQSLSSLLAQSKRDAVNTGKSFNDSFQSNPMIRAIEYLTSASTARHVVQILADQDWAVVQNPDDVSKEDFNAYVWSHPDCPKQIIFTNRFDAVEDPVQGRPDIKMAIILAEEIHTAHLRESFDLKPGNLIDELSQSPVKNSEMEGGSHQSDPIPLTPMSERAVRHLIEGVTVSLAVMDMHAIFTPHLETAGHPQYKHPPPGASDGLSEWDILKEIRPDITQVLEAVEIARGQQLKEKEVFFKALEAYPKTQQALVYDQHYLTRLIDSNTDLPGENKHFGQGDFDGRGQTSGQHTDAAPPIIKEKQLSQRVRVIHAILQDDAEGGRQGLLFPDVHSRTIPHNHQANEYCTDHDTPIPTANDNIRPVAKPVKRFSDNQRLIYQMESVPYYKLRFPDIAETTAAMIEALDLFGEVQIHPAEIYNAAGDYFYAMGPVNSISDTKSRIRRETFDRFWEAEAKFIRQNHDQEVKLIFERSLDDHNSSKVSHDQGAENWNTQLVDKTRRFFLSLNLVE